MSYTMSYTIICVASNQEIKEKYEDIPLSKLSLFDFFNAAIRFLGKTDNVIKVEDDNYEAIIYILDIVLHYQLCWYILHFRSYILLSNYLKFAAADFTQSFFFIKNAFNYFMWKCFNQIKPVTFFSNRSFMFFDTYNLIFGFIN